MALVATLGVLVVTSGFAAAADVTRDSYRETVEPICKANTESNERILGKVRAEVGSGQLGVAAAQFAKASTELKKTVRQIKAVPRPAADAARLSRWLDKVEREDVLFQAVSSKLKKGDKAQAQRMVVKLTTNANAANRIVIPFEFKYCKLEPTRFT